MFSMEDKIIGKVKDFRFQKEWINFSPATCDISREMRNLRVQTPYPALSSTDNIPSDELKPYLLEAYWSKGLPFK